MLFVHYRTFVCSLADVGVKMEVWVKFFLLFIHVWDLGNYFQCDVNFSPLSILSKPRWPPRPDVIRLICNNFGTKGHKDTKLVSKCMFLRIRNSLKV